MRNGRFIGSLAVCGFRPEKESKKCESMLEVSIGDLIEIASQIVPKLFLFDCDVL
jgi:hypothetical protein